MFKRILAIAIVLSLSGLAFAANTATITTTGIGNTANVTQSGDLNIATIEQIADISTASQEQTGYRNEAGIRQGTASNPTISETATQIQIGEDNHAIIEQPKEDIATSCIGYQFQEGSNNSVTAKWWYSSNSTTIQVQKGTYNVAVASQVGNDGYIYQEQEGMYNFALITQGGSLLTGVNTAKQHQIGEYNTTAILQFLTLEKLVEFNQAYVAQDGSYNWAGEEGDVYGIRQEGNYNCASVNQNQDWNRSEVLQHGDSNTVDVTQNGAAGTAGDYVNLLTLTQTGNNNVSTVTQTYIP